jgi:hypothetical protein
LHHVPTARIDAGDGQVNVRDEPHGRGPERPGAAYLTDTLTDYAIDFIRAEPLQVRILSGIL